MKFLKNNHFITTSSHPFFFSIFYLLFSIFYFITGCSYKNTDQEVTPEVHKTKTTNDSSQLVTRNS